MASTDSIGLSGLLTSQRLLDLTGQNIANAQTPSYHRQMAVLAVRTVGQDTGLGVEILEIRRQIDQALESAILRSTFVAHDLSAQLNALRHLETQLNLGDGSIPDLLEQFFNQAEQLAGRPEDAAQRRVLLNTAAALTDKLNAVLGAVQQQYEGLHQQLEDNVARINDLASRIADLNFAVERNTIQGLNPNDLADRRDQLISQLAELVDVRAVPQPHGSVNVLAAGVPIVLGNQSLKLTVRIENDNRAVVIAESVGASLTVTGGELRGLLILRNDTLAGVVDKLTTLAETLVRSIDAVQATGLGLSGPFSILYGQRPVTNVNLPLSQAGLAFPPQAGSLFVSVTDLATGARTLHEVAIDPDTQSLQDVATALSGIPNLQAVIDPQTRALTIVAQNGYGFDFAGRLASAPQTVAVAGTSVPQIGGNYTGAANDNFTYTVVGSGTIGVSANLALEARNSAGVLLGSWNIGQGYEPGSNLPALQGVTVGLSAGTVNNGDSFLTRVVAQPDTAWILPALGLNTFFQGELGTLQVRSDLLLDPNHLSSSHSGLPADGANLRQLAALRDQLLLDGSKTFGEFYANLAADVGSRVLDLEQRHGSQEALGRGLEAERQSISGVDPNEELLKMVQYQRSFQLSSRFLTVVNETLEDLLLLVN